jgi:hypothetical protein
MAQRVDIRLRLPAGRESYPIMAVREGDRARTGIILAPTGATIGKLSTLAYEGIG